ncbi:conserved Plasmodium protein, unknown function [Plasmodium ovale wallikeri]|uniref:Uncharacterized protein n=1 Tax=Plasmodium ovale wallikeri TaxID=864142 RepID=A0A1A8YY53_PLAOA|nr:conserved Plasmodium protein, unknown function [Plasmodium ovale wallikeri]
MPRYPDTDTQRRSEMKKTLENLKKNIYTYNTYACKSIVYHTGDQGDIGKGSEMNAGSCYNVKVDEHVERVMNIISPLKFHAQDNAAGEELANIDNVSDSGSARSSTRSSAYVLKYPISHLIGRRGKREQYRYTYLKSPFKYKYALRHYVFEKYKYHLYFYNITHFNINVIFNIILSSMTNHTSVKCDINWFHPGNHLLESEFLRSCFQALISRSDVNSTSLHSCLEKWQSCQRSKALTGEVEVENALWKDVLGKTSTHRDINLDLRKYNIQNLLPLFFQNKEFSENYKKLILLEEKSFKHIKRKIGRKKLHWFLGKNPNE